MRKQRTTPDRAWDRQDLLVNGKEVRVLARAAEHRRGLPSSAVVKRLRSPAVLIESIFSTEQDGFSCEEGESNPHGVTHQILRGNQRLRRYTQRLRIRASEGPSPTRGYAKWIPYPCCRQRFGAWGAFEARALTPSGPVAAWC
jgi:hypothetical protein